MSIPDHVRDDVRKKVWAAADEIGWLHLSPQSKSRRYDSWARDPEIGGKLERFLDRRHIRTYLKDSIIKQYARDRLANPSRPLRVMGVDSEPIAQWYTKPHGCRFTDGRVVVWGNVGDWKALLLSLHERTHGQDGAKPFGVVFLAATGRFHHQAVRSMVEAAAKKLGVARVAWLDT